MELKHFRCFVAVAESLHFGRAATQLRIAQPSLSLQIRQLEVELQVTLFERTKRHVRLTAAGHRFLEEAREVLAHASRAAMLARRAIDSEAGTLRIGLGYYMDEAKITAAIQLFTQHHPKTRTQIQTLAVLPQLASLRDERLDIAFVRPPIRESSLASEILTKEPLCVALPARHPFAARSRAQLSELANESFILVERNIVPVFHDFVLQVCRDAGFVPHVPHEADHPHTIAGMVAAGLGIALLPGWARKMRHERVVFRPLASSSAMLETAVAWRKADTSEALNGFLQIVRGLMAKGQRGPSN